MNCRSTARTFISSLKKLIAVTARFPWLDTIAVSALSISVSASRPSSGKRHTDAGRDVEIGAVDAMGFRTPTATFFGP